MKKILRFMLCCVTLLLSFQCFTQNAEVDSLLKSIEGKYTVDEMGNINITEIIQSPEVSKDELYQRAKQFFVYSYQSAHDVIQSEDKEEGIIIGKGIYSKFYINYAIFAKVYCTSTHILKIECKDNKVRITVSLVERYLVGSASDAKPFDNGKYSSFFPINKNAGQKNVSGKAFYYSYLKALSTIQLVKEFMNKQTTPANKDW